MSDARLMVKYWLNPPELSSRNREVVNQRAFPSEDEFLEKIKKHIESGVVGKGQRVAVFL